MTTLYAILGFLVLVGIFWIWLANRERKAGETNVTADVATHTVDVQVKQAQAAADAPHGKEQVLDRIRNGGGL